MLWLLAYPRRQTKKVINLSEDYSFKMSFDHAHRTAPFTTLTTSLYRRSPYKKVNVMRRCNFVVVVTLPPSFREVRPELSLRDVIPQGGGAAPGG
ncbi:hypothetical protein T03_14531 [Trichinella britovi]|uniref:Uncharacterized protein n=1 Tax=Trichinella britovi TaxID=45882 RepID=A0A0V1CW43_TRIBR|nr:hypothetical protein T03_14531 [Trichinella britovi]